LRRFFCYKVENLTLQELLVQMELLPKQQERQQEQLLELQQQEQEQVCCMQPMSKQIKQQSEQNVSFSIPLK
jgi:hypothetical protein